ncbi:hypothetical protein RFI_24713, partial [Reticulomyxa filosa]
MNEYTRNVIFAWSGANPSIHPVLLGEGHDMKPPKSVEEATEEAKEEEEEKEKEEEERERKE